MGRFVLMVVVKSLYTFLPIAYCLLPGASPKSCLIRWVEWASCPFPTHPTQHLLFPVPCSLFPTFRKCLPLNSPT
ncbi:MULTISPECIES: hypothetical protein [unclassified Moorena]|uniref:hypothetical protein n=1 Tax=unclassified Moorena TaxID=2683338 RepID=UPI00140093F1|nr:MULTISPECIES: hypothetical protein [unclassified Moorena]NEO16658.1 hypothetical protein [Moorena sp. SIO3E8]NEQ03202.1 hypothetical protein [Moorena sp. SIO3F7]